MQQKPSKSETAGQFGKHADAYAASPGHARGADLNMLVEMVRPALTDLALDVATGAGHTAARLAPSVRSVTAIDLAPPMIEQTVALAGGRGLGNVEALVMDAEAMAFEDGSFDLVTCRIAPHHFPDLDRALREIVRVLRPSGRFGLEDNLAPPDPGLDLFINRVERALDPTHVRSYSEAELRAKLSAAGFTITGVRYYRKTHLVAERITRSGCSPEAAEQVYEILAGAPPAAREHFELREDGQGRVVEFTDDKILICAVPGFEQR